MAAGSSPFLASFTAATADGAKIAHARGTCVLRHIRAEGLPEMPDERAAESIPVVQQAARALRQNAAPKLTFTALAIKLT